MVGAFIAIGAGLGLELYGDDEKAQAAQEQADQEKYQLGKEQSDIAKTDNMKLAQEQAGIVTLQTQQADALSQFSGKQATAEGAETESEQSNYTSAFQSIGDAEQKIGGEQAQAAGGASSLVAQYAARGIKINSGTVNIAGKAGQGSQIVATEGTNGTGAGAGTAAVTAVAGSAATPGAAAVAGLNSGAAAAYSALGLTVANANPDIAAVAGTPAIAAIEGKAGTSVTAAQAATPMQLGVKVYDPETSPLTQLAAYTHNVNMAIQNEQTDVVTAGNAELKGIADQAANFETNAAQNLLGFQTVQNENLAAEQTRLSNNQSLAGLGEDISSSNALMEESFTAANLATYDASLWLSAFSSIASTADSVFEKVAKMPSYVNPADPSVAATDSSPYRGFGLFGPWG